MKLKLHRGTTSKLIYIFVQDSTKTDGSGLPGLVFNAANLTAFYRYEGQTGPATPISLVAGTLGTWASGSFVAEDATNMPGHYEVGLPNAVLATGGSVRVEFKGAANMVVCPVEIELDAINYQDAAAAGLTSLTGLVNILTGTVAPAGTPFSAPSATVFGVLCTPPAQLAGLIGTNVQVDGTNATLGGHFHKITNLSAVTGGVIVTVTAPDSFDVAVPVGATVHIGLGPGKV